MSKSIQITMPDTDEVRRAACKAMAQQIRSGAFDFQFRFHRRDGVPVEVWLYQHVDRQWKKIEFQFPANAVAELYEQMSVLAKRDYADDWSCHSIDHCDRTDIELKFRRERVEPQIERNLESYLLGCLFYGHHDSGLDARHRIRFQGH